jgi:hypothetical protein
MNLVLDITSYNDSLATADREIAIELCSLILKTLPDAEGKVWHGSPVWFLDGNPIVGYTRKKSGMELLFWSGQSFESKALKPMGNFKAAALSIPSLEGLNSATITQCLLEAKLIQWDYKNLPKARTLAKFGDF